MSGYRALPERVWVIFTGDHPEPTDVVDEREDGDTLPEERAVEYVRADQAAKAGAVEALEWIERFTSDRGDARQMDASQARILIHRRVADALGGG